MAKTIQKIKSGLNIKFLKKPKAYYLVHGNQHIAVTVNDDTNFNPIGFDSFERCKAFGCKLVFVGYLMNMPNYVKYA